MTNSSSVTETDCARACRVSLAEAAIPCLQQLVFIRLDQNRHPAKLNTPKAAIRVQPYGREPELRFIDVSGHVNVGRFTGNHPRRRRTDTARSGERSAFEETLHGDRSGATPLVPPRLGHPRAGGRLPEPSERSPESRAGSRWIMLGCSRGFGGRRWGAAPTPTLSEPVLRNPVGVDDWFGHEDTTPSGLDGHRCPGSPAKRGALGATAVPPASTRRGPGESRCTARVAASITAVMWSPAEERGKRSEKWGVGRAPMLPMPGIRDWEPVGEPAGMVCAGMPATAKR